MKNKTPKLNTPENNGLDVDIAEFSKRLSLFSHYLPKGKKTIHIATSNISRPGLFLAGFYDYFAFDRVQVIGEQETAFLNTLTVDKRAAVLDKLFAKDIPCVILSSGLKPSKEMLEAAKKHDRVLLGSSSRSTIVFNELSVFFAHVLAPTTRCHGVLVDIYGVGVLIMGKSGVGKSETVLELLQRTHRLVADDAVDIKKIGTRLVGTSPESIRHFLEVRGIGVIDISLMYGAGAVVDEKEIDLVVKLEEWNPKTEYERLGAADEHYNILDIDVPMLTVPVKTGRNLAVILEVATRNYRLKTQGHNALEDLIKRAKLK